MTPAIDDEIQGFLPKMCRKREHNIETHTRRAITATTSTFALSTRLGSILFVKMATIMGDKINDLV